VAIDVSELSARVLRLDDEARAAAHARLVEMYPPGALGRLGELAEWLAAVQGSCPTRPLDRVRFVEINSSTKPAGANTSPLLAVIPATVRLVEGPHDAEEEGPVDRSSTERAFEAGLAVAGEEADRGADLFVLAEVGVGSAVAAAAAVAVLTGTDVASVVGRGTGIDDREWMRRCAAVRDTARAARRALGDNVDVIDLLVTLGSTELAACTGFLVLAAIRRTPVILDGLGTTAAALAAHRLSPRTARWQLAGHASPDPGQAAAVAKLRLRPMLDYAISLDDGTGALLAVPHLQVAARLLGG
jgi:nicotinate-nucleotide--dimethylbenzimidazole phosphoribosyltransferase